MVANIVVNGVTSLEIVMPKIFAAVRDQRPFCVVNASTQSATGAQAGGDTVVGDLETGWRYKPTFQCLSSGSTGLPRRIVRTHLSWIRSFNQNAELWSINMSDSYAVLGDLAHSLSLYAALEALYLGCDLHLLAGARPDRQLGALSKSRVTIIYATPAQIRLLGQSCRRAADKDLETVRLVLIGGSKLDGSTAAICRKMFANAALREFYGSSETSFVTVTSPDTPDGSVGLPYPEVEISIRKLGGELEDRGRLGEIWVRSPYLFQGYASGDPGSTRWEGDFLSVGDRGWLDADGFLFLAGRKDRMVTVADQNVYPEEIENFLLGLPGVERAAVVPLPDPMRGNRLVAVMKAETPNLALESVLSKCRSALGNLKTPKRAYFVDDWPLLRSGKTDINKLKLLISE